MGRPVVTVTRANVIYVGLVLGLCAAWPLAIAWRHTRGSTIRHALAWAWIAWAAWLWFGWAGGQVAAYAALTLTAATGIAVFGARRPGAIAWHFVVIGLLVVLWMPWLESFARSGVFELGGFRCFFLGALILIASFSYVPTRGGYAMIPLLGACLHAALVMRAETSAVSPNDHPFQSFVITLRATVMFELAFGSWFWMNLLRRARNGSSTDQLWSRFRDTFGAVWALRLREQFNAAAQNANWPVRLGWRGLLPKTENPAPEWHDAIVALQKRFSDSARIS